MKTVKNEGLYVPDTYCRGGIKAVKTGEFKDNGKVKALYRKTGTVML